MKNSLLFVICLITANSFSQALWMRYPEISPDGSKIAFSYQGDIFVVSSAGGTAVQVTSHPAHDFKPVWAPDGQSIAYASNRKGNFDVYLISSKGGVPMRLTEHSSTDIPYDFSADGKNVIFGSRRLDDPNSVQFPNSRLPELYQVPVIGGREKQVLTIPAEDVQISEDGKRMLFHNKKGYEDPWRKHHTSSITRDIIQYSFETKEYTQITFDNVEDRNPVFGDNGQFFFLSEKSGTFNIWSGDAKNPYQKQLTTHKTHPVRFLSKSKTGSLCYGYNGEIYIFEAGVSKKVSIQVNKDASENEFKINQVSKAEEFAVSPNKKEIAFIYRGEVFVTSIDYATTKRITNTPEQERSVSFSPDGMSILYASERNQSWNIYQTTHGREGEKTFYNATLLTEKELVNNGEETFQPSYSPDGKEIAYLENRTAIKVYNIESKKSRLVLDGKFNYSYSDGDQYFAWSPDSKWIVAEFFEFERWNTDIGLIHASGKEAPINLTKSGYGNGIPKFAMDGQMIYYTTDKYGYRSHGSWGAERDVEAIFLNEESYRKFTLNEEEFAIWKEEKEEAEKALKKDKKEGEVEKEDQTEVKSIQIELADIEDRQVRLTIHSSSLADFLVNNEGTTLYYLSKFEKGFNMWTTNFKEKETKMLAKVNSSGSSLEFEKDEKNIYFSNRSTIMKLDVAKGEPTPIEINSEMILNENAERAYMFYHAWRQVREKFYVEDLHGVDWELYKDEYARFLPYITNGYDFAEMLSELLGEINASHTGARYGEYDPNGDQTASLGCFLDENYTGNGLKILEIMDKSPLLTKTKKIKNGVIIEKIDGISIKEGENYYALLNRKADEKILIAFYDASTKERWDEIIKPISDREEYELLYERWVKNCEAKVDDLSGGKLGYVHIKGMDSESFRVLFDKALGKFHKKDALIIDTRFNGGGWLHDDLATFLSGKMYMSFEPRGQKNMGGEPIWKWQKGSCVLMSEGNYSDAHLFPYTYKALGIGKLIGMPVPGTGTAVWWERMVDGKTVFGIPQIGMRSVTEGFLVENHDLVPDIQVNNEYSEFTNGNDQQLKAAVDELMK